MSNLNATIRVYFRVSRDSFWEWRDDGKTITWRDGKTIAFSEELAFVLARLTGEGLPRLGSLLLLMAATRDNWGVDGSEARLLSGLLATTGRRASRSDGARLLQRVLEGLDRVRRLASSLRSTLQAKAGLAEYVFEDRAPAVAPADSAAVADAIRPGLMGLLESGEATDTIGYGPLTLLQDLAALASRLERVQPEAIELRLRTGIASVPAAAEVDPLDKDPLDVRQLSRRVIEELLEDSEHQGVAKVAKQLFASTTMPRPLTAAREREAGGYSDIANRGTPDRLLLSELAQDGLTLAVRVAMNEAMYLRRETPPTRPRLNREVLVDISVPMWGVPRVLATSVALALAATTQPGSAFSAWRVVDRELDPIDLTSREGVVVHLAWLTAGPHFAAAIGLFAERLKQAQEPVEAIVLTSAESLADPVVAEMIRAIQAERLLVASVSNEGEFKLVERRARAERVVRQVQIDLRQILPSGAESLRASTSQPAIFRTHPFPLRLGPAPDPSNSWYLGRDGVLSLTGDGRLMRWTERGRGAQQISDQMPPGRLWWASGDCFQGLTRFVVGKEGALFLVNADLIRQSVKVTRLNTASVAEIAFHNGALFARHGDNTLEVIDPDTGAIVHRLATPTSMEPRGGRYYKNASQGWAALSFDGVSARLEEVLPVDARNDLVGLWDCQGVEGPMAINKSGTISGLTDGVVRMRCASHPPFAGDEQVAEDWRHLWTSPDGKVVGVACNHRGIARNFRVDIDAKQLLDEHRGPRDPRVARIARNLSLRNRINAIGVLSNGELALRNPRGGLLAITTSRQGVVFEALSRQERLEVEAEFEAVKFESVRYHLFVAEWADGSRAVLDSRGLIHLMPARTDVPEVSLVLAEGELTGWSSGGLSLAAGPPLAGCFGKSSFLDAERLAARGASHRIYSESVLKFAEGIRATA